MEGYSSSRAFSAEREAVSAADARSNGSPTDKGLQGQALGREGLIRIETPGWCQAGMNLIGAHSDPSFFLSLGENEFTGSARQATRFPTDRTHPQVDLEPRLQTIAPFGAFISSNAVNVPPEGTVRPVGGAPVLHVGVSQKALPSLECGQLVYNNRASRGIVGF